MTPAKATSNARSEVQPLPTIEELQRAWRMRHDAGLEGEHELWHYDLGSDLRVSISTETGRHCFWRPLFHVRLVLNDTDFRSDRFLTGHVQTTHATVAVMAAKAMVATGRELPS